MSEWGKGVINNNIGWGKGFDNNIGWGSVYAISYSGETIISEVVNSLDLIVSNFKARVLADGGTFEADLNLLSILTTLSQTE